MSQQTVDPFDPSSGTMRPRPGGAGSGRPVRAPAAAGVPTDGGTIAFTTGGNELLRAGGPLLALAPRLASEVHGGDLARLKERIDDSLQRFQREVAPGEHAKAGHYVLCALLDDVILHTPWGSGAWSSHSLSARHHNDRSAGVNLFRLLHKAEQDPVKRLDLLELIHAALCLGFQGELRESGRAGRSLGEERDRLYQLICRHRTPPEVELSPRWRGLAAPHRPLSAQIPSWTVGVAALVLLVLIYGAFKYRLDLYAERIADALGRLPPVGPVEIVRADPVSPVIRPSVAALAEGPAIDQILAPQVAAGLVAVEEDPQAVTIRLIGDGLFASGSDQVREGYGPVLRQVGDALSRYPGRILVVGHTDDVPVSASGRFATNWELSMARAEAVASQLVTWIGADRDIRVDGRGDTVPIASNQTAEGRARNRRVEVIVQKSGS